MTFLKHSFLGLTFAGSLLAVTAVHAAEPKEVLSSLDARLAKIGAPKLDGQEALGDKQVPALYFGARKINGNFDVVDEIRKGTGAAATIFVKSGDEFVRVSTNVLTPEGKRGVGTTLARNKAYEALSKGETFCAQIDVLGTPYDSCYGAIKDGANKVVGATYVGFKK